jgi:cell division septum initiation protein DivIVA
MNIIGNTAKDDVIVLGGREFKRVKNGLDEAQVASFIDELIKERDKLAQSQDHITSLNRLAERTIVESDKLATQIKTEATEQAKAESAAILDKAKEQARQMADKRITEAVETANEKANAIKAKAEKEATMLLENEKNKIRNELRNLVNQQFGYLLEELEHLKQQAAAIQVEFDNKSPEPREEKMPVTVKITEERNAAAVGVATKGDTIVVEESTKTLGEHLEPSRATAYTGKSFELSSLLQVEEQSESDKPQWEVEILPPFNISEIMEVVAYLDKLPEVANTEMIVPQISRPSILVFLRKPMNVVDVLKTIPAVAYVEEVTIDKAVINGRPRKVRMGFSGSKNS